MKKYVLSRGIKDLKNNFVFPKLSPSSITQKDILLNKGKEFNEFFPEEVLFFPLLPKYIGDYVPKKILSLADFHGWIEESPKGILYIISKKFRDILTDFNLPAHRLYEAKVLFNNQLIDFYVF